MDREPLRILHVAARSRAGQITAWNLRMSFAITQARRPIALGEVLALARERQRGDVIEERVEPHVHALARSHGSFIPHFSFGRDSETSSSPCWMKDSASL